MLKISALLIGIIGILWCAIGDWRGFNPRVPLAVRIIDLVAILCGIFWFIRAIVRDRGQW